MSRAWGARDRAIQVLTAFVVVAWVLVVAARWMLT